MTKCMVFAKADWKSYGRSWVEEKSDNVILVNRGFVLLFTIPLFTIKSVLMAPKFQNTRAGTSPARLYYLPSKKESPVSLFTGEPTYSVRQHGHGGKSHCQQEPSCTNMFETSHLKLTVHRALDSRWTNTSWITFWNSPSKPL